VEKEEKLCFQYGREAAAANLQNAPCYDKKKRRMVSGSRTERGHRRNIENMRAWHKGYFCQEVSEGKPLERDRFLYGLFIFLPDAKEGAFEAWAEFAEDRVSMKQYVDFTAEPDEVAVCRWHDTILAGFILLTERFSKDTAAKVCDLGLDNCCLYPWEMERAAEELQAGTGIDDLVQLRNDGKLKADEAAFPALRDVLNSMAPSKGAQLQDAQLNMTL